MRTVRRVDRCRAAAQRSLLAVACCAVGLAIAAVAPAASAAERTLRGEGSFRAPPEVVLAALPASSPLRAADLRSGALSFEIVYDDGAPDADPDPYGGRYPSALRAGWVQIHQRSVTEDLRGAAGSIVGDAIPDVRTVAAFPTSGEFDRVFFVRLDPLADPRRPALYLSTSTLTVAPATIASR
jgi:hypothetical protein